MLVLRRAWPLATVAVLMISLQPAAIARSAGGGAHNTGGIATRSGHVLAQVRSGSPSASPARPGTSSPSGVSSGPPAAPVTPSTSSPPSMVGSPAPKAPAIAPLSPQQPTQFSTGGTTGSGNLALSPGASSRSPSESAPSAPGGGGKTLADCMGFWEPATHMTKGEWRQACKRTLQEFPTVLR